MIDSESIQHNNDPQTICFVLKLTFLVVINSI